MAKFCKAVDLDSQVLCFDSCRGFYVSKLSFLKLFRWVLLFTKCIIASVSKLGS